jgi:mannosidase alpha-like ER degradation enhancer 2
MHHSSKSLSCSGKNTWSSSKLRLIDALDTLIVMKNYTEFKRVSDYIVNNVDFDKDINMSVFETDIQIVGGILSAHLLFGLDYCSNTRRIKII